MEGIARYLITVIAATLICGILNSLFSKDGALAAACRLLSGLFLALAVMSPIVDIEWSGLLGYIQNISVDAQSVAAWGEESAKIQSEQIIKSRIEAYILDKASLLDAQVTVCVSLSAEEPFTPISAEVTGSISPYAKAQLSSYMENDLGISKEAQVWTG